MVRCKVVHLTMSLINSLNMYGCSIMSKQGIYSSNSIHIRYDVKRGKRVVIRQRLTRLNTTCKCTYGVGRHNYKNALIQNTFTRAIPQVYLQQFRGCECYNGTAFCSQYIICCICMLLPLVVALQPSLDAEFLFPMFHVNV